MGECNEFSFLFLLVLKNIFYSRTHTITVPIFERVDEANRAHALDLVSNFRDSPIMFSAVWTSNDNRGSLRVLQDLF